MQRGMEELVLHKISNQAFDQLIFRCRGGYSNICSQYPQVLLIHIVSICFMCEFIRYS